MQKKLPKLSDLTKIRILEEKSILGTNPMKIAKSLNEVGYKVHRSTISRFFNRFETRTTIKRQEGSARPMVITPEILSIIQEKMFKNDETTTLQLQKLLHDEVIL